jgi:hypothetical protein
MSKKLIAVAAAAALALTALVAVPASANTAAIVTINDASATGVTTVATSAATPAINHANTANVLKHSASSTAAGDRTAVKFTVAISEATARAISVKSGAGVKVLSTLFEADGTTALKSGAGTDTLTATDSNTTTDLVFYAYTNSTTEGTVAITANNNTTVYYVVGTAGLPYNIVSPKFPSNVTTATQSTATERVSFQITDVFGNVLKSAVAGNTADASQVDVTSLGSTDPIAVTYNTTRKQFESYAYGATGTTVALSIAITAVDLSDNGWPKPVKSAFSTVSAADLAGQVTALTAQVATLTSTVATLTSDYNALAKKWNKGKKKSKRVALK